MPVAQSRPSLSSIALKQTPTRIQQGWRRVLSAAAMATLSYAIFSPDAVGRSSEQSGAAGRAAAAESTGAVPGRNVVVKRGLAAAAALRPLETMVEGGGVRPPRGYTRFCQRDRKYCAPHERRKPGAQVHASKTLLKQLSDFNRGVNAEFVPREDRAIHGMTDHWTFPTHFADCEDYVLEKQSRLLAAGWPREALLIGVVVGEESPFHAVLIVRTSAGELVLDNMTDEVLDWRDTGYTWVIRQSTQAPERWVRVSPSPQPIAAGGRR